MEKHLHIIHFTVAYPVNYGGAMDLFYKLPALHMAGVKIHLHCFDYGRGRQPELEKYCVSVDYYERHLRHKGISNTMPYIVSSRKNEQLLQRLLQDDHPILMEGIHCTYLLLDARFSRRHCYVRLHNVEYLYYRQLSILSGSILRKIYYWIESRLLRSYEKKICNRARFWAVSGEDVRIYQQSPGCKNISYLPLFIPQLHLAPLPGAGSYCLYHGDLSVEANEKAVRWLVKKVFADLNIPLVIAGKDPSAALTKLLKKYPQFCLVGNPRQEEMEDLVRKAQILVMPSFTTTGIKVKLLNGLLLGRHCIVNTATVAHTGLSAACHVADDARAFSALVQQLFHRLFTPEETMLRKQLLGQYNNQAGAQQIISEIWAD